MRKLMPLWLVGLLFALACSTASAQQFSALIDADRNALTGCSLATADGAAVGIEWRVTATVGGDPPQVTAVERARCENGSFAAPIAMAGGYPVGLNNGVDGADVVEFAAALADLTGISRDVNIYFLAQTAGGADLLGPLPLTIGSIISAPVLTPPAIIPTVHWLGLTIIFFAVLLLARRHRALRGVAMVLMLVGAGLVWAANFIADGQVGDWATETPLATSPAPSSTDGARDNDIVAVWAADETNRLFFRIDVLDLEDAAPVANPLSETTLENQPLTITLSGSDQEGAPLTFSIVVGPINGSLGAITQLTDTTAEVVYTPALDFAGSDSFSYRVNDGLNDSAPATVSITVTGVNDAPSFTAGPDQTVNEDAGPQTVDPWASNIDDGDAEVVQGLSFEIVGNTNAALFSTAPTVSAAGVLTYTPADDVSGTAMITLRLRDDGGTANGGIDVSPTQSFSITVNAVNDAPSFVAGPNQAVDEDAGAQVVDPWATAISPGPADEAGQIVAFTITGNTNPALFSVAPSVSPTGVLSYTPAPSANGVATITLVLSDNGGTANGGIDTSDAQSFTISVNAVNNAPSFTVGPDQVVDEDAGPQLVDPWATNIDDGDPEVVQGLSFEIVGNTNAALFSAGPAVSVSGALSYTSAPDAFGSATITLRLRDDGGTANGGVDVSPPQNFSITVNPVDDPPVAVDDNATLDEDSAATPINVLANDTDVDGGPIAVDSVTQPANGVVTILGGGTALDYQPDPDYCNTDPVAPADSFTYTLAPGGSTATVSVTVTCINDAPVNTVPGTQQTPDDDDLVFNTLNGNAISVADVDAGNGLLQMTFSNGDPANGTLTLANPGGVLATLTGNGTDEVIATGTLTALNLALNGPDGSLTYSPPMGVSAGQTLTVTTSDQGNTGSGGPLSDVSTIDISVDAAPVVSSSPGDGDLVANTVAITIGFSELVDVVAGITLTCGGPNLITGGDTGAGVTGLNLSYTAPLPAGSCTLTVPAASVSDVDLVDPPDNPLADYIAIFTVDAAPEVTSTLPSNGAVDVANSSTLTVNFSEAVDIAAGGITLNCGAPVAFNAGPLPASNVTSILLTPSSALPDGAICNGQVVASLVSDSDAIDPPDQMVANFNWSFSTDAAPEVSSLTPAEAAVVSTTQAITVAFSENVDLSATAFTLDCAGAIAMTGVPALPATNTPSIVLTPTGGLPEGATCVFTVVAAEVIDSDSNDPPNAMLANVVRNFSVDAAPTVTGTTPANAAINVDPTSNITVNFSESVNFDSTANAANTSFDLECPGGSPADFTVLTASPATSVVLNPVDNQIAGSTCTLSVRAAGITDVDVIDPPDNMAADFVASFSFAAVANDDAYTVTPHLTLAIGAANPQGGGVLVNDILGSGAITGFGFAPACTGTAAGNQLDAGAANGRLTLNADGGFSYEPPAAVVNTTRTFCYTVTGGDTANVVFTLQNTELVWFVDAATAGGGIGTQARPFQTLGAAAGADTANDTIHLAFSASAYTGGITLEGGERLIGSGSGSTLAAISGLTPIAGSAFPALGGSAPTITCVGVTCITLGTGNTLRGFNVGNAGAAGTKIGGTSFGTLTVAELTLSGDGRALGLTTGTLNGSFVDIDVTTGNLQGIALDAVGGTWSVSNQASVGNVADTALSIVNTPAGGGITFTGGLSVNKSSAGAGVNFNANAAPVNLGAVSITTGAGAALTIDNSAGTTTVASGSLTATGGPALNSSASALSITLASASSGTSGTQGINLNGISGTVAISGGAISGSTGTAFLAQGTLGTTSYAGTISKTSIGRLVDVAAGTSGNLMLSGDLSCTATCGTGAGNHGLRVTGRTSGTLTFSGASKVFNSSTTNPGVSLTSNTGATLNFTGGGLAITTTGGAGFEATGGGTVTVQGAVNTIVSTTGTALNVANTTIGGAGLNFRSISSDGGTNGIVLNNTGAGTLVVSGNAAAGTGGTIQNKAIGISLTSTQAPSFSWMQLNTFSDYAIRGTSVVGFSLANSVISGVNGNSAAADEGSVRFDNLLESASITNTSISGGFEDNFKLVNNVGSLNRLIFSNVTIGTNSLTDGNDGITLEAAGPAIVNVTVQDSVFTAARGDLLQYNHIGTGSGDLVINNSTFSNGHPGIATGGGGISLFTSGLSGGNVTLSVTGNTFRDSVGDAIVIVKSSGPAIQTGSFSANAVGVAGLPNSGATEGSTLRLQSVGQGTQTWSLLNNTLHGYNNFGFEMRAGGGAVPEGGAINNTLTGNLIAEPGSTAGVATFPKNGLHYNIGTNVGDTFQVCANLGGAGALRNEIYLSGKDAIPATGLGDIDFRIRNRRAGIDIRLPGYAGPAAASESNINGYIVPRNDLGGTPFGAAHVLTGTFSGTGTTCP